MFFLVLENLVGLVVLMGLGYICRKSGILTDESVKSIARILTSIAQPATIFLSMQREFDVELLIHAGILVACSIVLLFIMLGIGVLLSKGMKAEDVDRAVITFSIGFPNMAYMGLPVVHAVLGDDALFYAAVMMITFSVLSPTLGVWVMTKSMGVEKGKYRPHYEIFASIIIGLIFFFFSIKVPAFVEKPISMAGGMMTPLSMLIIGNNLAKEPISEAFSDYRIFIITAIKLIVAPILAYALTFWWMPEPLMLGVLVYMFGMPVAAMSNVYAENVGANVILASRIVFVSTVLSVITIPFLSFLL